MLETGIKGHKELMVTPDKTAKAMGSGALDVFATPWRTLLLRVCRLSWRKDAEPLARL